MDNKEKQATELIKQGLLELKKILFNSEEAKVSNAVDITTMVKHELEDGTIVYTAKELAEGVEILSVATDGAKIPLVEGDFKTKDGKIISVKIDETGASVVSKIVEAVETEVEDKTTPEVKPAVVENNSELEKRVLSIENSILDLVKIIKEQQTSVVKMSKQAVVEVKIPTNTEVKKELSIEERAIELRKNMIASLQK